MAPEAQEPQESKEPEYEAPELEDIGDLIHDTGGHEHGHPSEPLHPGGDFHHPSFSE